MGKNSPASGIRIFEEHNSPVNSKTRHSNKSLSLSPSQHTQNSHNAIYLAKQDDFGSLVNDQKVNSQTNLSHKKQQLSYQVAPLQNAAAL